MRYVLPIGVFVVLIVMFVIGLGRDPSRLPSPFIDKPAPAFSLPDLENPQQTVSNDTLAGRPVLVNFWATWCAGCYDEHPFLMQLAEAGTIPVYGINWRDDREQALQWLERYGDPYTASGFDGENRTGIDWGVYGAPETFLLDGEGTIVYKHLGPLDEAAWEREFVPRIAQGENVK